MKLFTTILLQICFKFISAELSPSHCLRVVGGSVTNIAKYPSTAAVLQSNGLYYEQICGGVIVNERHILTAAHCFLYNLQGDRQLMVNAKPFQIRVGSSTAHMNGYTHNIERVILYPYWNRETHNNDVAIMVTDSTIVYSITVQPADLADDKYELRDNEPVWAIGWGLTEKGLPSEELRHVQVWTINHNKCQELYKDDYEITSSMLCSGWLEVGGRDHCTRDSGSPVFHYGTVIGISSLGAGCGLPNYPGINVRISRFKPWILRNTVLKNIPVQSLKIGDSALYRTGIKLDVRVTLELGPALESALKSTAGAPKPLNRCDGLEKN